MNTVKFRLNGVGGMVMHNGHLADPQNSFAKQLKQYSGKRKKTDADFEAMSEIEFKGSLYLHENGNGLEVVLPGDVLEASIINGAKKSKEGTLAKSAMFVDGQYPLEYDGSKNPEELWEDKRFVFMRLVRIGQSKIMRTRAFFKDWSVEFEVQYNPDLCNISQIERWVNDAGMQVGVGTWRPKYGRFTAELLD